MNASTTLLLVASGLLAAAASGTVFTVTNPDDAGPGSLRQAVLNANAAPGLDTIRFNLPGPGVHSLAPLSALPDITNAVVIDGFSQPGSSPNTLAAGNNAVLAVRLDGVNLTNGFPVGVSLKGVTGCTVRGLIIVRFDTGIQLDASSGNTISGNWIGLDFDGVARGNRSTGIDVTCAVFNRSTANLIGGLTPDARNVISGNGTGLSFFPTPADHNIVQGNFIGTDATGTLPRGNMFDGIHVQAATNITIGGASPAARNLICASGTGITLLGGSGDIVQGNFIGLDVSGRYDLGNLGNGIMVQGCAGTVLGGANAGNSIGNNAQNGIYLLGCTNTVVLGNSIGTDATGAWPFGNGQAGIGLMGTDATTIGGPAAGAANLIQLNAGPGVSVQSGARNAISANAIFDNGGPGIDLGADGVTPNDPTDFDTGANQLQNYPVLTNVLSAYGATQVRGTLDSTPNASFRLEFFASAPWDAAGLAEGQTYLGAGSATTGPDGLGAFAVTLPAAVAADAWITATATDAAGNTSEFSAASPVGLGTQTVSVATSHSGNTHTFCWPVDAAGFVLEVTDALGPNAQWRPVTTGITTNGGLKCVVVTNSQAATNQFFRLRR